MHPDTIRRIQYYNRNLKIDDPDWDDSLDDMDEDDLFDDCDSNDNDYIVERNV
jgi:hypothetical protein